MLFVGYSSQSARSDLYRRVERTITTSTVHRCTSSSAFHEIDGAATADPYARLVLWYRPLAISALKWVGRFLYKVPVCVVRLDAGFGRCVG